MNRKIWFTADTHFGHQRTLDLSRRPFESVQEMDGHMIYNWNDHIQPQDLVYHNGDFGDYEISHLLNGTIYLLLGNYERADIASQKISIDELKNNYGFSDVFEEDKYMISIEHETDKPVLELSLVHEPTHRTLDEFTLFGHIHKLQMVKDNALNIGVDCHNFCPIDLETVLFYKEAIQQHYDEDVFSK